MTFELLYVIGKVMRNAGRIGELGFTLVEIMIVVAIISLLAAVTLPNLVRARLNANESAAQANLRTILTAFETYASSNQGRFPTGESVLTDATPPYLNASYAGNVKQGYSYVYNSTTIGGYTITAIPTNVGTTGNTSYRITTGGVWTHAAGACGG